MSELPVSREALRRTPLYALHRELDARFAPFAGYDMPVQYPAGAIAEHKHCRAAVALFDIAHMGQVALLGPDAARELEALTPADLAALAAGRVRYALFTDSGGGVLDDFMATNAGDHLLLVVNAARKAADLDHLRKQIGGRIEIRELHDRALLSLQGPLAATVMTRLAPQAAALKFMSFARLTIGGAPCWVTRSGYTGEDGYEISVVADQAEPLAKLLLAQPEVKPAGLAARDSLRLEAGLCLYGHDIDRATTPVEAGLAWTIAKRRRAQGGFPGAEIILRQLVSGPPRRRVGIRPEGRVLAREGTPILGPDGVERGLVTSGGFGPTVEGPIAMGYLPAALAAEGATVSLNVRGQARPARIVRLPFVAHRYYQV